MGVSINFATRTAAFDERGIGEVERVIDRIKRAIAAGERAGPVSDSNGITIGSWSVVLDVERG